MKRIALLIALLVSTLIAGASAPVAATGDHVKLPICHRTASDSNPWVIIRPDSHSWYAHLDNHVNHTPKNGRTDKFAVQWSDGSWRCTEEPPPPPPPPPNTIFDPDAEFMVCGDPRLLLTISNDGNVPVVFRISYRNAKTRERTVFWTEVRPDKEKQIIRWVVGRSYIRVTAMYVVPRQEEYKEVLVSQRLPRSTPWGVGQCPVNLADAKDGW